MMEAALAPFEAVLRDVTLHPPAVQVVSNLTGTWLTAEQATDPRYWSQHLRHTVQFHACLATLLQTPRRVLLEVGPGKTLTALAGRHDCVAADHLVAASCRHPKQHANDLSSILQTVGQLWARGVAVD